MRQQPFASPEEALAHYGKKGMRWGVRNEEDESSGQAVARRNETTKGKTPEAIVTKSKTTTPAKTEQSGGLSPNQKKAIFAAGVGVVAVGGFIAYKHYARGSAPKQLGELTDWGNPMPKKVDMSALKTQRLSDKPLGAMGKEGPHALFRSDKLTLNTTNGYADWLPAGGFANEHVAARHDSTIRALEAMREKYPAIRNMNIEVVPMSHGYPPGSAPTALGMASQLGRGEARLYYNDVLGQTSITDEMRAFIPSLGDPDTLGTHEMGHILAGANGLLFDTDARKSAFKKAAANTISDEHIRYDIRQAESLYHKRLFKKHGMSFEELSKLGGYAATDPVEALAELSANYHSPKLRSKMDPALLKRAEAMFNEMGGVT